MGRALIQSGGTDGRYTIQVDYGSAQRAALLAALNQLINRYDADIIGQQADVDVVNGMLEDLIGLINQARNGVMPEGFPELAEPPANLLPGSPIDEKTRQLVITSMLNGSNILRANLRRYTLNIEKMKMERAEALKKAATLTTAQATVTKDAWCCTYTETAPAGANVATIDVNGESALTLIAPNARAWTPPDGVMTMPHVMSPEQSFFNTAILPGWQKHRPRYRWGTITALDVDADTASVSLAPATSSAQRLDINLFSTLSNIPVEYMTCNASAFEVGDRCIVEFIPGALSSDLDAKVIGFLDNPKPCGIVMIFYRLQVVYGPPFGQYPVPPITASQEEIFIGRPITAFTAPAQLTAYNGAGTALFLGWLDGREAAARADGKAKEGGLDVAAVYLFMPTTLLAVIKTQTVESHVVTGTGTDLGGNPLVFYTATVVSTYTIEWDGVDGEGAITDLPSFAGGSSTNTYTGSAPAPYSDPPPFESRSFQGYRAGMPPSITRTVIYTPGAELAPQTVTANYQADTPPSGTYRRVNAVNS